MSIESGYGPCPDKHTPQTLDKDIAREWWMDRIDPSLTAMTVSPGALPAFRWMKWRGIVYVADICQACMSHARRMSRRCPEVDVRVPAVPSISIQELVAVYCLQNAGTKKLGAVDMDLPFKLHKAIPILIQVVKSLAAARIHAKVLLTYVNHRDGMGNNANDKRIKLLESSLPKGAKYVDSHNYRSVWSNEHHGYSVGSSMSIAEIQT